MLRKRPRQTDSTDDRRRSQDLEVKTVRTADGQEQQIVAPPSYDVPKEFVWDTQKLRVAELIAEGVPVYRIVRLPGMPASRTTITKWRLHPDFARYIDSLVTEEGLANKAERIAAMKKLLNTMFDKLTNEFGNVTIDGKNAASIIDKFFSGLKQMNEDLRGYDQVLRVESEQKIEQQTVNTNLETLIAHSPDEEREKLQAEFAKKADAIIRGMTGEE